MMRVLIAGVAALAIGATCAAAQTVSSKSRAKLFSSQVDVLDNRASSQYRNSVRLKPQGIHVPTKWGGVYKGKYRGPYLDVAKSAARRHGIPEDLFLKLVQQESGWNPRARSHKGALGLAQLMPATARALRVDPLDPVQNLDGGARYLAKQYRTFGSWRLALAAYNAGPAAVQKYGGIPPYRETKNYVRIITGQ